MRSSGLVTVWLVLAYATVGSSTAAPAAPPAIDQSTACATDFAAFRTNDPTAVIVSAGDLVGPFRGTITAYGRDTKWSGTIDRWNAETRNEEQDATLVVHAGGPIEGIEYTPQWASCSFHSGVRVANQHDNLSSIDRIVLEVADPQPVEPAACSEPYVSSTTVHAAEPALAAQQSVSGSARIAVALDDHGVPQATRIVSGLTPTIGFAVRDAARLSTYRAAVFRCKPVASGYEFTSLIR
jgi:hypothetical protein